MILNHINLPVENVPETRSFFESFFDFSCVEVKGDNVLVVLKDENDFTLVLMTATFNKSGIAAFPPTFHIGFLLETKEAVLKQYNRLKQGNVLLEQEAKNMRGVFGFYFVAPGNILVEISSAE
jgi:catechol 2,3-dioxygenase-like lactoylglutathione lyase family enzyme